jgi:glycosyltransferase involved in cell wall biosynthesis
MRRLLMICYDFPPSSLGIWRTLKYCRYMGEFGWEPAILTVKPTRSPRSDYGPLKELPPGTPVRRTEALEPNRLAQVASDLKARFVSRPAGDVRTTPTGKASNSRLRAVMDVFRQWVLIPDERIGWYPFAMAAGNRWLREERFDAVYTTSFPSTSHVIGTELARRHRLPLLTDFRDIWIGNYVFYTPATPLHDRLQRKLERRVISTSSCVVSATRQITDDFLARHLDQPVEKFVTITNGFDEEDFQLDGAKPDRAHFTITYAGTMYGSTSPRWFLEAVAQVLAERPEWRNVLRLRFVGSMIEPFRQMITTSGLDDISSVEPYLEHGEALRVMAEADALLLIVARQPGSHIMLTQKVFEYAAARRPILGLVPDGAAKDFLLEIREGEIVPPDETAPVADALRRMLSRWESEGREELPPNPALEAYRRRNLTQRLCAELDRIAVRRRRSAG